MKTNGSTPDRRLDLDSTPDQRPVLYLDIDDTLVQYRDGNPSSAPGAREFMEYALERFEVRWLTTWCPNGRMGDDLLGDLCEMLEFDTEVLGKIRGFDWEHSESKADGIAWLEHLILGRPFVWIEDDYGVGPFELRILSEYGFSSSYRNCNVTEDPESLQRLHRSLASELEESEGREAREGGEAREAGEAPSYRTATQEPDLSPL